VLSCKHCLIHALIIRSWTLNSRHSLRIELFIPSFLFFKSHLLVLWSYIVMGAYQNISLKSVSLSCYSWIHYTDIPHTQSSDWVFHAVFKRTYSPFLSFFIYPGLTAICTSVWLLWEKQHPPHQHWAINVAKGKRSNIVRKKIYPAVLTALKAQVYT